MNDYKDLIINNNISLDKIIFYKNYIIIESCGKKYLLKKNNNKNVDKYNDILIDDYFPLIDRNSKYTLYLFIEDGDTSNKNKLLIRKLSKIHINTIIKNDYKINRDKTYKEKINEINKLMMYYLDLQDYIEEMRYVREDYYQLIINISKFYKLLNLGRDYLNKWYESEEDMRYSLLINNCRLDNFIVYKDGVFIDLDNSYEGLLVNDIISFYKNNYNDIDMDILFKEYNLEVKLNNRELYWFYYKICVTDRLGLTNNINSNISNLERYVNYIDKTLLFILKENEEYQETD